MQPVIDINYLAVAAAVVINFVFGWAWYSPLFFGNAWAKEMGMDMSKKPDPKVMMRGMILMIIGTFLIVWCLAHNAAVWRPSTWGVPGIVDGSNLMYGFMSGFFTWLGFFVPQLLGAVAWENKSWKLFGINAAYNFIGLQISGMILAFWR